MVPNHIISIALNLNELKTSTYFNEAMVLICLLMAIIHWRHLFSLHKILLALVFYGLLADAKMLFPEIKPWNDHVLGVYVLTEILVYIYLISEIIESPFLRRIRNYLYVSVVLIWLVSYSGVLSLSPKPIANGFYDVVSSLMIVVLSAIQLLQLTKREEPLARQSDFWILIGIFSYFMCCSFLFSFIAANFLSEIWFLHSIFFIIKSMLFTIGLIMVKQDKIYYPQQA